MNILEEIIAYKKLEVEKSKENLPFNRLKETICRSVINCASTRFTNKLKSKIDKKQVALIAEIKKSSPSKGVIRKDFDPIEIAKAYKAGGASCLSVLTDEKYFQGKLSYIKEIKEVIDLPILRKDFIIDPYQIYESIYNQTDCILLIVAALERDNLKRLFELASENKIDILVEVHNEKEMETALEINPEMIGINNRDLTTFNTDLNVTKNLVSKYKKDLTEKIIVSESGIFTRDDILFLTESGVYSFLIGEGLMREKDIKDATKKLIDL